MRVCYFGTYRAEYSRNRIMIEGLRRSGIEVVECHVSLWRSIEDRVATVSGGWRLPAFWWRVFSAYAQLLWAFWPQRHTFDVVVCGYPGQFDVFLARLLSWWTHTPLVWDVFMSIYLIALERGLGGNNQLILDIIRCVERLACRLPDRLIQDTAEYVRWFHDTHNVSNSRFRLLPTGADSSLFQPLPLRPRNAAPFRVLYYGAYIPNHSTPTIIEAARLLAPYTDIEFKLIGDGPDLASCMALATTYGLQNVRFRGWLDQAALIAEVAEVDVCLGAFGATPQSLMTVQNKVYEGLAMQRAVITGDGPAVRAALCAGEEVLLCARCDPQALATAILRLYFDADLREQIAIAGQRRFQSAYTLEQLGVQFKAHLEDVVQQPTVKQRPIAHENKSMAAATPGAPLVSVVIPNLNSPLIGATLEALHQQTLPLDALEVLVVGRDDLGLVHEDTLVRKIDLPGRPSAAANRNRGMQEARGEIICFTDADCVPAPDWIATLLDDFADPAVLIVGGGVAFAPGNYWSVCDHLSWFSQFLTTSPVGERKHLPSLNLALRRELYAQVGGFDESFPGAAGEDTEWTARIAAIGVRLHFDPQARVDHAAQRFSLREVWRHGYCYGRYSPKVRTADLTGRIGIYRLLPQHRWRMVVMAPMLATLAALRILWLQPRLATLAALPGVWLTKLAWVKGAADAFDQRATEQSAAARHLPISGDQEMRGNL